MGVSIKGAVNSLKSSTNILLLELFTSQNLVLIMAIVTVHCSKIQMPAVPFPSCLIITFSGKRQSLIEDSVHFIWQSVLVIFIVMLL